MLPESLLGQWTFMDNGDVIADLPNRNGDNPYKLAVLSRSGDTLSKIPNYDLFEPQGRPLIFTNDPFFSYNNQTNYYRVFADTIFAIQSQGAELTPRYIFNLGSRAVTKELRSDATRFVHTEMDYIIPWSMIETRDYLFVGALRNKVIGLVHFLYDKRSKSFSMFARPTEGRQGMRNDIDNGLPFLPQYKLDEQRLCMMISAYEIIDHMEDNPRFDSAAIFSTLDPEDNLVIAIAELTS